MNMKSSLTLQRHSTNNLTDQEEQFETITHIPQKSPRENQRYNLDNIFKNSLENEKSQKKLSTEVSSGKLLPTQKLKGSKSRESSCIMPTVQIKLRQSVKVSHVEPVAVRKNALRKSAEVSLIETPMTRYKSRLTSIWS